GIELYLDTRQERFLGRGIYNREVFQIYMIPGDGKDIEAHFSRRPFRPRDAEIASVLSDRGYRIEARMPWRNFPWMTPERMGVLGFDVAINARSAGGPRDYQIMWHGTVENWRNAINFGRMYYESPVPEELVIDTPLAPFVDAPMTIDGDFADWDVLGTDDNRMAIDSREQVTFDRRVGEHKNAKIFAAAMTAWDSDNLYLAVDVTDPVVRPSPEDEGRPWEGSGIEVYIDARPPEKQGSKTYDERVLQLFLVPQGDEGKAYYQATRRENFQISMECKRTESGYRIEAAIPWKNFADLSIETTNQVGFDIAIDARGPEGGRSLQMMWHGTGKAWRDPSVFGVLRLGRKGKRPRGK
ncbi:MAG: sugar-binding protein, partial [Phycisphaerae bacterium]|nr:sugar-binding protein [Phycisphaerae bacterium]